MQGSDHLHQSNSLISAALCELPQSTARTAASMKDGTNPLPPPDEMCSLIRCLRMYWSWRFPGGQGLKLELQVRVHTLIQDY
jgi:hypothetical protein